MEKNIKQNYIKKIAEVGSVSVAAEILGISQPALSAFLKKTELELGVTLFDRSRQPMELTEAGHVYIDYLDREAALRRELLQNLADIESMSTGTVVVGGASFFNIAYLPGPIAEFAAEYPGVDIEIVDGKVPELVTMSQKGIIDLFITPLADEPERFCYKEMLEEKVYLAVPGEWEINSILAGKAVEPGRAPVPLSRADFEALCENTFIVLRNDLDIGRKMEALFTKYGCRPARTVTAEQTMTTLNLTQAGVGVSLITDSSIRKCGLAKLPKLYLADDEICTRKIYIAYPRNKYLSRPARKFIETLERSN